MKKNHELYQATNLTNNNYLSSSNINNTHNASNYILTLTRSCSQNCDFCAVDAYGTSIEDCIIQSHQKQKIGEELSSNQWLDIIDKILINDPHAYFDLSGGDCLILPWVRNEFIPSLANRINKNQISITATAESIQLWLKEQRNQHNYELPNTIHLTYDGVRDYSFKNYELAKNLSQNGFDIHFECPLTQENCVIEKIHEIYTNSISAGISEILLMRYFPVGRGANEKEIVKNEPTDEMYCKTIKEFKALENKFPNGPKIKIQCSLKFFDKTQENMNACKIGKTTWCIMPNGDLLICPWAYGLKGKPLHQFLVAGNLWKSPINECQQLASNKRKMLNKTFSNKCKILEYANLLKKSDNFIINREGVFNEK